MVAAASEYLDSFRRLQTSQVDILYTYCEDSLRDSAAIYHVRTFSERILGWLADGLRRFKLGLDHFGDQRNRVGVQAVYGVPMECFATQQN